MIFSRFRFRLRMLRRGDFLPFIPYDDGSWGNDCGCRWTYATTMPDVMLRAHHRFGDTVLHQHTPHVIRYTHRCATHQPMCRGTEQWEMAALHGNHRTAPTGQDSGGG
jgi:hypothetical protein